MTVSVTDKKKNKMFELCLFCLSKHKTLTIRKIAAVVGLMNSYEPGTTYGGNYIKRLECDKNSSLKLHAGNFDKPCFVSPGGLADILWWRDNVFNVFRSFDSRDFTGTLTCDASLMGWGAHYNDLSWNGRWNSEELFLHINVLELYAVYFALKSLLCTSLRNSYFRIRTDNTTAVSYINKKGGTRSPDCSVIAFKIWSLLEHYNCFVIATHIPGSHNVLADIYSRKFNDNIEWTLSQDLFDNIVAQWGMPSVDLFASRLNNKCNTYVSWKPDPNASFIDAFSLRWDFDFMYLFPPFCLVSRAWAKIVRERAHAILVCPDWPGQPWYAKVQKSSRRKLVFPQRKGNLIHPCREMQNDQINSIPLVGYLF